MKKTIYLLAFFVAIISFSWEKNGISEKQTVPHKKSATLSKRPMEYLNYVEGFPPDVVKRLRRIKEEDRIRINQKSDFRKLLIDYLEKRWEPGQTLKIAFNGGDSALHEKIAEVAQEWIKYGNLKFDFGIDKVTGKYRAWSEADLNYSAEIRIGFSEPGYWSFVGQESVDSGIVKPDQASMNFQEFDVQLPLDYRGTILHEFGHALGFQHEHQRPEGTCDGEFDWPATYGKMWDYYGWDKEAVDYNLRKLPYEQAYELSEYDPLSIMHYYLPYQVFARGVDSPCYIAHRNEVLSKNDIQGIGRAYQKENVEIDKLKITRAAKAALLKDIRLENNDYK